jgi:hypothetical protein
VRGDPHMPSLLSAKGTTVRVLLLLVILTVAAASVLTTRAGADAAPPVGSCPDKYELSTDDRPLVDINGDGFVCRVPIPAGGPKRGTLSPPPCEGALPCYNYIDNLSQR